MYVCMYVAIRKANQIQCFRAALHCPFLEEYDRFYVLWSSAANMRIVTGDYSVSVYEGTEQYRSPQLLVPHPQYNKTTNNADIMLIKVRGDTVPASIQMQTHLFLFIYLFFGLVG